MATRVSYNNLESVLEKRIADRLNGFMPDNKKHREGLLRIGIMLEHEVKKNIVKQRLVDTGSLLNSIRHKVEGSTVTVGSYGVPYAAAHEFGFNGPQTIRGHQRLITQAFGRPIPPKMVDVKTYQRMVRIRERPYIRPAIKSMRKEIEKILKGMMV